MSDERSERLRNRRKQSQERARDASGDETDELSELDDSSERDKSSKPSEKADVDDATEIDDSSVKEEQVGTYMYLPQSQKKELERLYNVLKAEYEYEYDEQFEKNRAFYPLVVRYGFEKLDSLDISEVRERVQNL